MAGRRAALALAGVLLGAAACGGDLPAPSLIPDPGLLDRPLTYDCGGLVFDPEIFDGPGNDELVDDALTKVLREYIAQTAREGEPLPEAGWHLLARRTDGADYLTTREVPGEGTQVLSVTVQLNVAFGRRASWNACRPAVVLPPGLNVGSWTFDVVRPRQSAQVLRILVHEEACASGRSPDGRIVGPAIKTDATTVTILFGIQPVEGAAVTCPTNPSALVDIDLGQRIGDRDLVDPSRWPNVTIDISP